MTLIVDASAIGALLFNEPAAEWVHDEIYGETLSAPGLFHFELGNLCWKKLRRFPDQAAVLRSNWMSWNAACPVTLVSTDLGETMDLARTHDLTFYDASYLWLAQQKSAGLISLDAKLVRVARGIGLNAPSPSTSDHTTPRPRN